MNLIIFPDKPSCGMLRQFYTEAFAVVFGSFENVSCQPSASQQKLFPILFCFKTCIKKLIDCNAEWLTVCRCNLFTFRMMCVTSGHRIYRPLRCSSTKLSVSSPSSVRRTRRCCSCSISRAGIAVRFFSFGFSSVLLPRTSANSR